MKEVKATAFVCQDYMCQLPTTEIPVMLKLIAEKVRLPGAASKSGVEAAGVIPPVETRAEGKR